MKCLYCTTLRVVSGILPAMFLCDLSFDPFLSEPFDLEWNKQVTS